MAEPTKRCPYCSEEIHAEAKKCKWCDEFLERPTGSSGSDIGDDPALRMVLPVGRSPLSILAGYAGLFSLIFAFLGPIAVVLGILAIRDLKKNPERRGMGRAVFGIIAGVLTSLVLVAIIFAIAAS